jgi:hypothetical protein
MDDKPKRKAKEGDIKTWTKWRTLFIALAGVGYGFIMLVIFRGKLYVNAGDENGMALVAFLGIVPMMIGGLSTYMIPVARRNTSNAIRVALVSTLVFLGFTVLTSTGLIICVLMALPFILAFAIFGVVASRLWRFVVWLFIKMPIEDAPKKKRYHAFAWFTLLLPLLVAPIELSIESPVWYRNVQDEIIIKASAEEVWENIIRMETIAPEEQRPSLYHMLGIPRPIRATLDYDGLDGERIGYFEDGLIFVEKIIQWDVYSSIRFAVDVRHNDESTAVLRHIGGRYFDVIEAGYDITQFDAEHVILRLDSDYRLSTNFNGYGAFWSDWILHDFQNYVLTTVKNRIEGQ